MTQVKLNVTELAEGDEEGTLLVFPQEVCIKGITAQNAEAVIKALLVEDSLKMVEAILGVKVERELPKNHLFVCSHLKRDKRCGLIGPHLVKEMRSHIKVRDDDIVGGVMIPCALSIKSLTLSLICLIPSSQERGLRCPVRACSHVGGHAYAGNVLAFSRRDDSGQIIADWYGYVSPIIAKDIIDRHIMKGEILMSVWRGQMGMSEEEQEQFAKQACENCQCDRTDL